MAEANSCRDRWTLTGRPQGDEQVAAVQRMGLRVRASGVVSVSVYEPFEGSACVRARQVREWLNRAGIASEWRLRKAGAAGIERFRPLVAGAVDVASAAFLKTHEWRRVRYVALKLHGPRCQCCGATPAHGAMICVDHIKPRKTHPNLALDINNLQVLCEDCNAGKGNSDATDWR